MSEFVLSDLEAVFERALSSLWYRNAAGSYVAIAASDAQAAFVKALATVNTGDRTYVRMTVATDRALLFDILDAALDNLKSTLASGNPHFTSFADITLSVL